jgi:hypothetical protein
MGQIFQYVRVNTNSNRLSFNFEIKESFLGFCEVSDQNAVGLEKEIVNSVEEN